MEDPQDILPNTNLEITLLKETIQTTTTLSATINQELNKLNKLNKLAIININPLLTSIKDLSVKQANFKAIDEKINILRGYATRIKTLNEHVDSYNDGRLIKVVNELDRINDEFDDNGLGRFNGLKESIGEGILSGEIKLRDLLIEGVKRHDDKVVPKLYDYLNDVRDMSLDEMIVRERMDAVVKGRDGIANEKCKLPVVSKDVNYLYDEKIGWVEFSEKVRMVISREREYLMKCVGLDDERMVGKVEGVVRNGYIQELEKAVRFIEDKGDSYTTMYYELWEGVMVVGSLGGMQDEWLGRLEKGAASVFDGMKRFTETRIKDVSVVGLDGGFLAVMGRTKQLGGFQREQVEMAGGTGVGEDAVAEKYWAVIEGAVAVLERELRSKGVSDENVGVLLLVNLDGVEQVVLRLMGALAAGGKARWERLKKRAMDQAAGGWGALTAKVMVAATTQRGGGLSMGAKEAARFAEEFGREVDVRLKELRGGVMGQLPGEYRRMVVRDVVKTLVPTYRVFCGVAHQEGKVKLKYTPDELQKLLLEC